MTTENPHPDIILADTITKLGPEAKGAVIVSSSHGGRYAGYLALKAAPRAFILNDAGVGKDQAGIASLAQAERAGVAAATLSHLTCRIGDAADMMARGIVSHVNARAQALGVSPGMSGRDAAMRLLAAKPSGKMPEPIAEARRVLREPGWQRTIVVLDSISLVRPEDAGQIVVSASHGALVGGKPETALKVDGFAGVFSDAGLGIDNCGVTRLPALDARGIAGITVSARSARIGEGLSVYQDGIISHVNQTAAKLGAVPGEALQPRLLKWAILAKV